ncbi:hypothetical protein UFOVP1355_49 [uncultured Caudovirales phage]|uniref:Uncharacterized protein n=1 Tax=uncultured Caudovirales phage TaxID=2100421 RepID=A0A6J5S4B3_9CAUD|nr:hypothetical protein UFOVP1355_49 [uncultured Caudovirales phage]
MDEDEGNSTQEIRRGFGGPQPGSGRPAFVPTDEERAYVEKLSGIGLVQEQIAALIRDGIHSDTLRDHFGKELLAGKAKANAAIGGTLYQKAIKGDTGSLIWWTKTQMRWAETQKHEIVHTGISITDALEAAKARLIAGDIIDAKIVEPRQIEDGAKDGET